MIQITYTPIEDHLFIKKLNYPDCGALLVFYGISRNHHKGKKVEKLYYEGYEEMAEKKMAEIREKALSQFDIKDLAIVHRLGEVPIQEASLLVVVASAHRKPALQAVDFVIDNIKKDVPIWKKEFFCQGASEWVEPRAE